MNTIESLTGALHVKAIPVEIAEVMRQLIEGGFSQIIIIAEASKDGQIFTDMKIIDEDRANVFAMVGAVEMIRRDYMRKHMASRIEYQEKDDDND